MGRVTRFELATFGTTNRRSNQLSYTRHTVCTIVVLLLSLCPPSPRLRWTLKFLNRALCAITKFRGGADQTRTDDPLHAMQVLYQLSYNPMTLLKAIRPAFALLLRAAILNFHTLLTLR